MATAEVFSGVCGFTTRIQARLGEKRSVELAIEPQCPNVSKIIGKLERVDPFEELCNSTAVCKAGRAGHTSGSEKEHEGRVKA